MSSLERDDDMYLLELTASFTALDDRDLTPNLAGKKHLRDWRPWPSPSPST